MSEKRFVLKSTNAILTRIFDNRMEKYLYNFEVVDLLNEQQALTRDSTKLKSNSDTAYIIYMTLKKFVEGVDCE